MDRSTRRKFLALGSSGLVGGLAGCLDSPFSDDGTPTDTVTPMGNNGDGHDDHDGDGHDNEETPDYPEMDSITGRPFDAGPVRTLVWNSEESQSYLGQEAPDGQKWVTVGVGGKNILDQPFRFGALSIDLLASDGEYYATESATVVSVLSWELLPGEVVAGQTAFLIPEDLTPVAYSGKTQAAGRTHVDLREQAPEDEFQNFLPMEMPERLYNQPGGEAHPDEPLSARILGWEYGDEVIQGNRAAEVIPLQVEVEVENTSSQDQFVGPARNLNMKNGVGVIAFPRKSSVKDIQLSPGESARGVFGYNLLAKSKFAFAFFDPILDSKGDKEVWPLGEVQLGESFGSLKETSTSTSSQ